MTTTTTTLSDFLLDQIAEDEAAARKWQQRQVRWPSQKILRECAAKRAIVAQYEMALPPESRADHLVADELHLALLHLAAIYADHPDYDPSWAVS